MTQHIPSPLDTSPEGFCPPPCKNPSLLSSWLCERGKLEEARAAFTAALWRPRLKKMSLSLTPEEQAQVAQEVEPLEKEIHQAARKLLYQAQVCGSFEYCPECQTSLSEHMDMVFLQTLLRLKNQNPLTPGPTGKKNAASKTRPKGKKTAPQNPVPPKEEAAAKAAPKAASKAAPPKGKKTAPKTQVAPKASLRRKP